MDPVASALVGAFFGAIVGAAASLIGVIVTERSERQRKRDEDLRSLRDARRQRLGSAYATVLKATLAVAQVGSDMEFSMGSETIEQRDARLAKMLETHMEGIDAARVQLMLDAGADDVLEAAGKAYSALQRFAINLKNPGTATVEQYKKDRQEIRDQTDRVRDLARRHLAELDKPI